MTTDGANRVALRQAIVTVRGDGTASRSVVTDDAGRFVFGSLPAGRFTVSVTKPAFLPMTYGAKRSGNAGTPLAIVAGQHVDVTIAMPRGAVVAGVVMDAAGAPMAGAQVAALSLSGELQTALNNAAFGTTDDRGAYRVYGLAPGEYIVVVVPRLTGTGVITAPSVEQMDAVLAELVRRQEMRVRQPGSTSQAPPLQIPRGVGVTPVYYPGTHNVAEATRLTLSAGDEKTDVNLTADVVALSTISGIVIGASTAVSLSIIPEAPRPPFQMTTSVPVLSSRVDAQGRFEYTNVAPGRYRIVARAGGSSAPSPLNASSGGSGSFNNRPTEESGMPRPYTFGVADVDVASEQRAMVTLTLMPGSAFSGRIRFDAERLPVPADLSQIRMQLALPVASYSLSSANGTNIGNAILTVPPVTARADGTFQIGGIAPGRYVVNPGLPADAAQGWWLRSAIAGGKDLLDEMPEVLPGRDISDVVVTFTDRHTELAGMLQTAEGQPAPEHFVLVFSQDRATWRIGSRRVRLARPGSDGRFSIKDLPPGDYWIAALGDVEGNEWQRSDFLAKVASSGLAITLGEGERKVQDLRVR